MLYILYNINTLLKSDDIFMMMFMQLKYRTVHPSKHLYSVSNRIEAKNEKFVERDLNAEMGFYSVSAPVGPIDEKSSRISKQCTQEFRVHIPYTPHMNTHT